MIEQAGDDIPDPSIYRLVFDGDIIYKKSSALYKDKLDVLDEIYARFQSPDIKGFNGRRIGISDIIWLEPFKDHFFYVDDNGFIDINFKSNKTNDNITGDIDPDDLLKQKNKKNMENLEMNNYKDYYDDIDNDFGSEEEQEKYYLEGYDKPRLKSYKEDIYDRGEDSYLRDDYIDSYWGDDEALDDGNDFYDIYANDDIRLDNVDTGARVSGYEYVDGEDDFNPEDVDYGFAHEYDENLDEKILAPGEEAKTSTDRDETKEYEENLIKEQMKDFWSELEPSLKLINEKSYEAGVRHLRDEFKDDLMNNDYEAEDRFVSAKLYLTLDHEPEIVMYVSPYNSSKYKGLGYIGSYLKIESTPSHTTIDRISDEYFDSGRLFRMIAVKFIPDMIKYYKLKIKHFISKLEEYTNMKHGIESEAVKVESLTEAKKDDEEESSEDISADFEDFDSSDVNAGENDEENSDAENTDENTDELSDEEDEEDEEPGDDLTDEDLAPIKVSDLIGIAEDTKFNIVDNGEETGEFEAADFAEDENLQKYADMEIDAIDLDEENDVLKIMINNNNNSEDTEEEPEEDESADEEFEENESDEENEGDSEDEEEVEESLDEELVPEIDDSLNESEKTISWEALINQLNDMSKE